MFFMYHQPQTERTQMKELATVFEEAIELRTNKNHYEAGVLLANTARKFKLDFDDLLDLFADYIKAAA